MNKILFVFLVSVCLTVSVVAQTDQIAPTIDSISPNQVVQGQSVTVNAKGSGLTDIRDVSIAPELGVTIKFLSSDEDRVQFNVSATCDAELGKRKLTIGGITTDTKGNLLYFYGNAGSCEQTTLQDVLAAEAARTYVDGIFPAGGVEMGKTQQGYMTGNKLLLVKSITVVGGGLLATLLPGATDEKLPIEFTADVKTYIGGRGLILTLKNGTEIHGYRDGGDAPLRFDVVEAQPEVVTAPVNRTPPANTSTPAQVIEETPPEENKTEPVPLLISEPPAQAMDCQDIGLLINGKPFDTVTEELSDGIKFTLQEGPGVIIKRAWVVSPRLVVQDMINKFLREFQGDRPDVCTNKTNMITIPKEFPGGAVPLTLHVIYFDKNLEKHTITTDATLHVKKGNWIGSLMGEDAQAMAAAKLMGAPARLERDVTLDDFDPAELEQLGLSKDEIQQVFTLLRKGDKEGAAKIIGSFKKVREQRATHTIERLNNLTQDIKDVITKNKKGNLQIDPIVDTRVFELERNGKKIIKSKVTVEVPAGTSLGSGDLVLYIPKEVAADADELAFSDDPQIIQKDPVVKWAFKNVPQDQYREYSFTANGDAQNFDVVAQAAADKPALLTRFISWLVGLFGGS